MYLNGIYTVPILVLLKHRGHHGYKSILNKSGECSYPFVVAPIKRVN